MAVTPMPRRTLLRRALPLLLVAAVREWRPGPQAPVLARARLAPAISACKPVVMLRAGVVVFSSLFVLCLLARSVGRHMTGYVGPVRRLKENRALNRRGER
jgi:hypothetical protein